MKFYSLLISVIVMFFSAYSYADTDIISNVSIEGLQNVKLKDVLSAVTLKKGECYAENKVRERAGSIAKLGYFDYVGFRFDAINGNLTFLVTEKPFIESVVFRGNFEFSTRQLKNASLLKENGYYNISKLEETKRKISNLYGDKGYVDCKIEVYPTVNAETNRMSVTFLITENSKIIIGGVRIEGATYFKDKKILGLMKTKAKKVFKENIYQLDLQSIETFYKNNGFMDYKFISSNITYNQARTEMFLTLNIAEGSRYKIGSVSYKGNFAVGDAEMKKVVEVKKGQIFEPYNIEKTLFRIAQLYGNKGYLKVEITPYFNKRDIEGLVDINLSIEENEIIYVGNIYIDGLVFTKDKVVRREMVIMPGDVLSLEKLRRSFERIYNLGFIDSVSHSISLTDMPNIVDIKLSIGENERMPGRFDISLGYSHEYDSLFGKAQVEFVNILGLGKKLFLFCKFDLERQDYEVSWTEPWLFDKNLNLIVTLFNINSIKSPDAFSRDKEKTRRGFDIEMSRGINDYLDLFFGYRWEYVEFYNKDDKRISSAFYQFLYNSTDYPFNPSRGNLQRITLQLASKFLGGDVNFIKLVTKSSWFFPIFWKFVLVVNFEGGLIMPYSKQPNIPDTEKFYVGRRNAAVVRGYEQDEVSPEKGGEIMGVIGVEYRFPIVSNKEWKTVIQGVLFSDIGRAWEKKELHLDDARLSVGFGIRLINPIIPLRFEWGYGLDRAKRTPLFYFGFRSIF